MKIAYLVNVYPTTSTTFIRREILALERQGIEVSRIALRSWDGTLADPQDQRERDITRYVLRGGAMALPLAMIRMLFTRPARLLRALALAWRVGRRSERPLPMHFIYLAEACLVEPWLRAAGIEHLHAHFGTNSSEVAMLVHALGGPRWSFTIHGGGGETYDGLVEKVRHCAFVVAVSSHGRAQLYRFIGRRFWPKVQVVHCGLEPSFHAVPATFTPMMPRFVCIGRFSEEKGQLLLVEAAARLEAQGAEFELVLAGDGEMRADIEALIAHYKLQDRVHITGWISSKQVREQIQAARALVLPSFHEGLPVVIMEAMALKRPIISTFVGGIPELVISEEHGWIVPAGDLDALTLAMRACLDAPANVLTQMGAVAHHRVLARHNVDTEASKLAKLFEGVIHGLPDADASPTSGPIVKH